MSESEYHLSPSETDCNVCDGTGVQWVAEQIAPLEYRVTGELGACKACEGTGKLLFLTARSYE